MVALAVLVSACAVDSRPSAPEIVIVTWPGQPMIDEYRDGASAWTPLGFDVVEQYDLPECERHWYEAGNVDCAITIGIRRDQMLREREGTNALSNRADRSVTIDTSLSGYDLIVAVAHEVGHIVLDTPEHTHGGVMGGASAQLEAVDYELACRTIHICVD